MKETIHVDKNGKPVNPDKIIKKQTVDTIQKQTVENVGVIKFARQKKEPKRKEVNNPITPKHRKQIAEMIDEWVRISNVIAKKSITPPAARNKLYAQGLQGKVNSIEQVEDEEFGQCVSYIKQQIRIVESYDKRGVIRGLTSEWRNDRIKAIHAKCKSLGVSDEKRKAYMMDRFGKNSLLDLTDDELSEFYTYVMSNPTFSYSRAKVQTAYHKKEIALIEFIGVLEAEATAKGESFDKMQLVISKSDILKRLAKRAPREFSITETTFNTFWAKQQICSCKSGPK